MKLFLFLIACFSTLLGTADAQKTHLSTVFTDNMILQREKTIPVWGKTSAETPVEISLSNNRVSTTSDKNGNFIVYLPAMPAGGPFTLKVVAKDTVLLQNIMLGDVWICSGQSNMAWKLEQSKIYKDIIDNTKNPNLRFLEVKQDRTDALQENVVTDGWKITSPENTGNFSAVGYFFANELQEKYNIPVGMINSSWGGTEIELWMSKLTLSVQSGEHKRFDSAYADFKKYADKQKLREEKINDWKKTALAQDKGITDKIKWYDPALNDKNWQKLYIPNQWNACGFQNHDGVMWLRTTLHFSEKNRNDFFINLGVIDDFDEVYVNGTKIGSTDSYSSKRKYTIPTNIIKKGANTLTIRILDNGGDGGFNDNNITLYQTSDSTKVDTLNGIWKCRIGYDFSQMKEYVPPYWSSPSNYLYSSIFNAMINPLTQLPIKGVIWYQGENNSDNAFEYRFTLQALINDWRAQWKDANLPFIIAQLPNLGTQLNVPSESTWAELRESQFLATKLKNTGIAITYDLGDPNNIHPIHKKEVGRRFALSAEHIAYTDTTAVYSGPIYKSSTIAGNKIIVKFSNCSSGLIAKDSKTLRGFAIAGKDKKYIWAKAKIVGDSVILWNETISNPITVRFAWAQNPLPANLYNKEGLPAAPFRTDNFKGITQK
jgi:sialate O-acetylesterase